MKKLLLGLLVMLAFTAPVRSASSTSDVFTTTIRIGDEPLLGRVWRTAVKVATLGAVQLTSDTIKQGEPFSLAFDHNGVDTDVYEERINTQLTQTISVTTLVNGTSSFPHPGGLAKGTYTFTVTARGSGGIGTSAPFGLSVTAGNPSAPGQIRIIKGQ